MIDSPLVLVVENKKKRNLGRYDMAGVPGPGVALASAAVFTVWGWVEKGVQSLHKEASEYGEVMPSSTATTLQGRAMHHPLHPPTMEVTSSAPRPAYSQPPIQSNGGVR